MSHSITITQKFSKLNLKIILLFTSIYLCSCQEKQSISLLGEWGTNQSESLRELKFTQDSVSIVDSYGYQTKAAYEIIDNVLKFQLDNQKTIKAEIKQSSKDSFSLHGYINYYKLDWEFNDGFEKYDFIGINTEEYLEKNKNYDLLHIYKLKDGKLKIRCNDQFIEYDGIPLFLSYTSRIKNEVALFIGKGLKLKELKEVYYQIVRMNWNRKVTLVLNKEGIDKYHILIDFITIWQNDLNEYFNQEILPPIIKTRKDLLEKDHFHLIEIDKKSDFQKLEGLKKEESYLFSINDELSVDDYIKLKLKLRDARKQIQIKIITEIKKNET